MIGRIITCVLGMAAAGMAFAQTLPPVSAFARLPAIESVQLAPDGAKFAYVENRPDGNFLMIRNVEDFSAVGAVDISSVKARGLLWAGDQFVILVFSDTGTFAGVRGNQIEFSAPVAVNVADMSVRQLMQQRRGNGSTRFINTNRARILGVDHDTGKILIPDLTEEDTYDLFAVDPRNDTYDLVERGELITRDWTVNQANEAVARVNFTERPSGPGMLQVLVRQDGRSWTMALEEEVEVPELSVAGLDAEGRLLIVRRSEEGRYGLYPVSAGAEGAAEPVFIDAQYDLGGVMTDPYSNLVVGVWVDADGPVSTWFDADLAAAQTFFDSAFGGADASITSWSRDRTRMIVAVTSGEAPPVYYLFDRPQARMRAIQSAYPELVQTPIAPRLAMEFTASDGEKIPGYLTLADDAAQPAPLIVLPHGGPEARDSSGFDWMAHFFASRGYAVLQPNFRGSDGFGKAWRDAGRGGWGTGVMQSDLTDGVAALVEAGIADPERVCIVGGSYGGYAALAGAVYTPDLYRCVVAIAPVSDLVSMIDYERDLRGRDSWVVDYWDEVMGGELGAGRRRLADISPANAAANASAPVLLLHGRDDTVVPIAQSRRMADALRDAGKDVQLVELAGEDHWMSRPETRQQLLEAIDVFLAEHLAD